MPGSSYVCVLSSWNFGLVKIREATSGPVSTMKLCGVVPAPLISTLFSISTCHVLPAGALSVAASQRLFSETRWTTTPLAGALAMGVTSGDEGPAVELGIDGAAKLAAVFALGGDEIGDEGPAVAGAEGEHPSSVSTIAMQIESASAVRAKQRCTALLRFGGILVPGSVRDHPTFVGFPCRS